MHTTRRSNKELTALQITLRESITGIQKSSVIGLTNVRKILADLVATTDRIRKILEDTYDEGYFEAIGQFFKTIGFYVGSIDALQSGDASSEALRKAGEIQLSHLNEVLKPLISIRPAVSNLEQIALEIADCTTLSSLFLKIDELSQINFAFVDSIETNPYADFQRHIKKENTDEGRALIEPLVISVQFSTDNEPWANPQVLMPGRQYAIFGKVKLNYIPENYSSIFIRHVSTTNDDFFILSIPEIKLSGKLEYSVTGQVVFKYAQNTFDPAIAIKIIAQLVSETEPPLFPQLIGYDELVSKIVDDKVFRYPTGFTKLNKRAAEIASQINIDDPDIEPHELEHFMILLSAVLNYSGYCSTYGIYKNISNINEEEFRDRLIAYLSSNPMLTSSLIKESHVGGGRIEVRFENIIAELKVEKSIADREKMLEKYTKQPTVYASALFAGLSILCILDLTHKNLPSAQASDNVFIVSSPLHGFEEDIRTSTVVAVIIDGNLKNPSSY